MISRWFKYGAPYRRLLAVIIMLAIAAGWALAGFLGRVAEKEFKAGADREAQLLAGFIVDFLHDSENASKALSQSEAMLDALSTGSGTDLDRANKLLDFYKEKMDMSASYLINRNGQVVATSNRNDEISYLGRSFASRSYFKGALTGRIARYFALGKFLPARGYFVAAPVTDRNRAVTGIVVNKRSLDRIEDAIKQYPDAYLVSPEGIIFLTSRKQLLYRALWPVAERRRPELSASGQFGSISFEALLVAEPRPGTYVRFANRELYLQRLPIGQEGWTLVFMKQAAVVSTYRWFGVLLAVVFGLLFLAFFNALFHKDRLLQAARDLIRAKEDWERTFDAVPDLIMIVDNDFRIQRMNSSMASRLGISKQEAHGRYCHELLHCHEKTYHACPLKLVLDSGQASTASWFDEVLNGHYVVTASPIYAQDRMLATVNVMHDVSELKLVEQSLKETALRLELALEGSNDATWEWDMVADRALLNARYFEMTGYAPEEVETNFAFFISTIHPDDVAEVRKKVTAHLEGRTGRYEAQYRMVTKSGQIRHVMGRGKVVWRDEEGRPVRMAGVISDITEQKRLCDELDRSRNLESIGLLAGGLSHDFNNVLNIIYGNITFARMLAGGDRAIAEPLAEAEEACERAKEFGVRLQAFSQGSSPAMEPVELRAILEEAVRNSLEGSQIVPTICAAGDLPAVEADPRQIKQVFENLLTNAKEAMPDGGSVAIDIGSLVVDGNQELPLGSGTYARISLQDQGTGIREKDLPRVFDPYFSTKDDYSRRGLGLGLSICHTIMKRHRGHIVVESEAGIGTKVTLYLPAAAQGTKS